MPPLINTTDFVRALFLVTSMYLVLWNVSRFGPYYGYLDERTFQNAAAVDTPTATKELPSGSRGGVPTLGETQPGWKPIYVFFGEHQAAPENRKQAGSQWNQDQLVLDLLGGQTNGYFLDLAANDAWRLSNTHLLEQKANWTGVCIEANPNYWRALSHHRTCHVVGAVVGDTRLEEVSFKFHEGTFRGPGGGIEREDFKNKPSQPKTKSKPTKLYTVPLVEILEGLHAPKVIDYFSLDVEGAESYILQKFPFEDYKFKVLTIERPKQELVDRLYFYGYRYLANYNKGEDTLWCHSEVLDSLNMTAIRNYKWREHDSPGLQRGPTIHDVPTVIDKNAG